MKWVLKHPERMIREDGTEGRKIAYYHVVEVEYKDGNLSLIENEDPWNHMVFLYSDQLMRLQRIIEKLTVRQRANHARALRVCR